MEDDPEDDVPAWRSDPPRVVAVLVAHQGERWLPRVLESLDELEHAPDEWIAVHDGVDRATEILLVDHFGSDRVRNVPSHNGFGEVVNTVLADAPEADWYWLLHDDAVLDPAALNGLLDVATEDDALGAVGPKVREWPSLKRLLEVGVTVTATGHREVGLEPGEPDAGQFDRPRDVLAVGTVGMLVRSSAWQDVGGFDPELPMFGDDVDFGWRLNSAGWLVRTAPQAVMFHAEASRTGRRNRRGGIPPRRGERRAAALRVLLANETPARFPFMFVRLFLGSLLRTVGFLLGKDLAAARRELSALLMVYGAPWKLFAARKMRAATRRRPAAEVRALRPGFLVPYLHGLDSAKAIWAAIFNADEPSIFGMRTLEGEDGAELEPEPVPDEESEPWFRRYRWFFVFVGLVALTFVADRGLFGGNLGSPVLPPSPDSPATWWSLIFSREHAVGLGSTSWPLASVAPLALTGTVTWFDPGLVIRLLLLGAVPLATLTAHRFGSLLTDDKRARIVWALSYGLLPVVSGAVANGRIGTVLTLVLAPVLVMSVWRIVEFPDWTRAMQFTILTALIVSFAPVVWWLLLPLVVLVALRVDTARIRLAVAFGLASLLALPTLLQRTLFLWRTWWEAGISVPTEPSALAVVVGHGGSPGHAPWWLAVPVIVLALLALVPPATRDIVTVFWAFAVGILAFGVLGSLVSYAPFPGAPKVLSWTGIPATLWLAVLMAAILVAYPTLRQRRFQKLTLPVVALALVFPVFGTLWFVQRGVADPLTTNPEPVVPTYVAQRGTPTLVMTGDVENGLTARAVSGSGVVLGSEAMVSPRDMKNRLEDALGQMMVAPSLAAVEELAALGVEAIHAPDVAPLVERRLDAMPGLVVAGSEAADSRVWMVDVDVELEERARASALRPAVAGVWLLSWVVVTVMSVPYRHSSEEGEE